MRHYDEVASLIDRIKIFDLVVNKKELEALDPAAFESIDPAKVKARVIAYLGALDPAEVKARMIAYLEALDPAEHKERMIAKLKASNPAVFKTEYIANYMADLRSRDSYADCGEVVRAILETRNAAEVKEEEIAKLEARDPAKVKAELFAEAKRYYHISPPQYLTSLMYTDMSNPLEQVIAHIEARDPAEVKIDFINALRRKTKRKAKRK